MSEDANSAKAVNLDGLKTVADDIYSRLHEKADKKALEKVANMAKENRNIVETEYIKKEEFSSILPEDVSLSYYTLPLITKDEAYLYYSDWDEETKQQSVYNDRIHSDSTVLLSLPMDTPDDEANEFTVAGITACEQNEGEIILKYTGEKPKRNFTLNMCIIC